jgi:hypothetical protein
MYRHSSGAVSKFLIKRGIPVLYHLSYAPDVAQADFSFPKLKSAMKGRRFEAVPSIQQTMTRELRAVRDEAFSGTLGSLYEGGKCCAEADGDDTE